MNVSVHDVIARLTHERSQRLDVLDYPGEWTIRQQEAYAEETARLDGNIRTVQNAVTSLANAGWQLASIDARIKEITTWYGHLRTWRKTLCDELLLLPQYVRTRAEAEPNRCLEYCIDTVDEGPKILLGASVYSLKSTRLGELIQEVYGPPNLANAHMQKYSGLVWHGSLRDVERENAELLKRREIARDELTSARERLDALIGSRNGSS